MEFRILGPVDVSVHGSPVRPGGARARAVLATLLVHANHVVAADQLVDELWPGQPAERAMASLQVRLSELRKTLRSAVEPPGEERLITRAPGYLLRVAASELDSCRFTELADRASGAMAGGDPATALALLEEALGLWRGPALAGIDAPSVTAEAGRLDELRLCALESRAEALLASGKLGEAIAELETLTAASPLRERLWWLRMSALYWADRQADALGAYHELRAILAGELGIEPGPAVRELQARILRQDPALDRNRGGVGAAARRGASRADGSGPGRPCRAPQTRYVLTDDGVHIAYQVLGQGDRDILFVPGLMSHLDLLWEGDDTGAFFRRLATLGRLILFDKRDTGLSDRAVGNLSLQERMTDVRAVLRAVGSERAVFFGYSEGAPMSLLFAATHPEVVSALILGSAAARWFPAPDYQCGTGAVDMYKSMRDIAASRWGQGDSIEWYLPSRAGSAHARELFARFERLAVTPGAFLRMLATIRDIDVRDALAEIAVPTLVIHRTGDRITPPFHGRFLASRIAGARYFEQPGDHSLRFAGGGDADALFSAIESFLAGVPHEPGHGETPGG